MSRGFGLFRLLLLTAVIACSACNLVSSNMSEDGPLEVGEKPEDVRQRAWVATVRAATAGYEQRCVDTAGLVPQYAILVSPRRNEDGSYFQPAYGEWLAEWFWLLPGDVNRSFWVNSGDLAIVAKYWGKRLRESDPSEVRDADLNQDGVINKLDAEIIGYNWNVLIQEHELQCRDSEGGPWTVMPSMYFGSQQPFRRGGVRVLLEGHDIPGDVFKQDPTGMEMRVQFITDSVLRHPDIDEVASTSNGIAVGYETVVVYPADLGFDADPEADGPWQSIWRTDVNERSGSIRHGPPNIGQETLIFRDILDEPLARLTGMFDYWIDETVEPYKEYDYYACTEYKGMRSVFVGPYRCRWDKQLVPVTETAGKDYEIVPSTGMAIGGTAYVGGELLSYQVEKDRGELSGLALFSCEKAGLEAGGWTSCVIDTHGFEWFALSSIRGKPAAVYFAQGAEGRNLYYARATCKQPKGPDDFTVCNLGPAVSGQWGGGALTEIAGRPVLTFNRRRKSSSHRVNFQKMIAVAKSANPRRLADWDIYPVPSGRSGVLAEVNGKPMFCHAGGGMLRLLTATKPAPSVSDWVENSFDLPGIDIFERSSVAIVDGGIWITGLAGRPTRSAVLVKSTTATPTSPSDWTVETTDESLLAGLHHAQLFNFAGTPVIYAVGQHGPVFAWPDQPMSANQPLCDWQVSPVLRTRDEMMNYHGSLESYQRGFEFDGELAAFIPHPSPLRDQDYMLYRFSLVQYGIPVGDAAEPSPAPAVAQASCLREISGRLEARPAGS